MNKYFNFSVITEHWFSYQYSQYFFAAVIKSKLFFITMDLSLGFSNHLLSFLGRKISRNIFYPYLQFKTINRSPQFLKLQTTNKILYHCQLIVGKNKVSLSNPATFSTLKRKVILVIHIIQNHSSISIMMQNKIQIATLQSQTPLKTGQLIVLSFFDILFQEKTYNKSKTWLFQNHIRFQLKEGEKCEIYVVNFCFELLFQMIEPLSENRKYQYQSTFHSIKLSLFQKYIQFKNPQVKQHLNLWRDHLTTKLNQRGFHQQFFPLKEIGHGHFANVYKVQHYGTKCLYAVKAFSKEVAYSEAKGVQSIMNEIQVMRSLNHPNLMKIFGVYETKNSMYICVQLLSGGQLYDRIREKRRFKNYELRKIMKSIVLGLFSMHSKGYMHRDLKPQNIQFRDHDSLECVIGDFGLVQNINQSEHLFVRCGTPGYIAPQILNSKSSKVNYNCTCDMYSLGVIFYQLLFGKSPFKGKTSDQVLVQNRQSRFNFEDPQYYNLSFAALGLLKGLLEKNPNKRLTSKQALQHSFLQAENKEIQESSEPEINTFKELKVNLMQRKESKHGGKKVSLQCQSPIHVSSKNRKLSEEFNSSRFKMKDQPSTYEDEDQQDNEGLHLIQNQLVGRKAVRIISSNRFKLTSRQNLVN